MTSTINRRILGHDDRNDDGDGRVPRRAGLSPAGRDAPPTQSEPDTAGTPQRYAPVSADLSPGGVMAPRPVRGPVVRAKLGRARRGWYAPLASPAPTTTRQAEILNPALVASPTDEEGVAIGRDLLSNSPVAHDSFTAYRRKKITSPAVIVLGVIGVGKSALLKTVYVLRPIILRGRRCVVLDRKDRAGEGEYCELTRRLGGEPFSMRIGGGGTVDQPARPADHRGDRAGRAVPAAAGDGRTGQQQPAAGQVGGRGAAGRARRRCAWPRPAAGSRCWRTWSACSAGYHGTWTASGAAKERLHQAGLGVKFLFVTILSDELAGLFDGPIALEAELVGEDLEEAGRLPIDFFFSILQ